MEMILRNVNQQGTVVCNNLTQVFEQKKNEYEKNQSAMIIESSQKNAQKICDILENMTRTQDQRDKDNEDYETNQLENSKNNSVKYEELLRHVKASLENMKLTHDQRHIEHEELLHNVTAMQSAMLTQLFKYESNQLEYAKNNSVMLTQLLQHESNQLENAKNNSVKHEELLQYVKASLESTLITQLRNSKKQSITAMETLQNGKQD